MSVPARRTADGFPPTVWTTTRALGRAVLLSGLLLLGGVLLGRVDLVLLAVPFVLGTALALRRRPAGVPEIRLAATAETAEGGEALAVVTVANADRVGYDLVTVRTLVSPWLSLRHGDRPVSVHVDPGREAGIELPGTARRWGRQAVGPASAQAVAAGGLLVAAPVLSGGRGVRVYPRTDPFHADDAMPRAAGLVGAHRSRRPGDGGELAGVRAFVPGDRLRRVDWRVSLRARQLHVAATLSDRDAEVVVLLDVLVEAGRSGGVGERASVLDTTVRAAAAIAEHYLHRGDRVSMIEYGSGARRLRPASGRRQYLTVLEWLLDVHVNDSPADPYATAIGGQAVSSNALIVVLTPLVDPRSAPMLARLARSGRFMVAVDTFPDELVDEADGPWVGVARQIWRLERANTIGQLREHGVPVVSWAGAGSLDLVLRDVARRAGTVRPVAR